MLLSSLSALVAAVYMLFNIDSTNWGHCFLIFAWIILWIPMGSWTYKLVKINQKEGA